ncbi:hypothetical protein GPALN_013103 [Globodera pallida]|nr:hypothetical protein GPALN_013103 [Globodera pallida]
MKINFSIESLLSTPSTAGDGLVQQMPSNCSAFSSPKTTTASVPYGQATALASLAPLLMPASCSSVCGGTMFNAPSTAFNFAIQHHQLGELSGGKRKRRHRTIFTEEQLNMLEEAFRGTPYPDVSVREGMADKCNLREERVEVWFKNRRAKLRKRNRGEVQQPSNTDQNSPPGSHCATEKKQCAEMKA